jgi:hypothetical protein
MDIIKGRLIYKCRHCEESVYETGPVREYIPMSNGVVGHTDFGAMPDKIWHECFSRSRNGLSYPFKHMGVCDLVGIQEVKDPEKKE